VRRSDGERGQSAISVMLPPQTGRTDRCDDR
jgi:hypothetical protein